MSNAIVIQLAADRVRALVAHVTGNTLHVDAIESLPIMGTDVAAADKQLSALLDQYHPAKAHLIVAVPSSAIKWQYLSLPPCPPEDLPALVRLQLDLESSRDDGEIGFDFLPLVGTPERPQRVLAMILKVADLARVRSLGRVSGIHVDAVVPTAMGWPALALNPPEQSAELSVFVALEGREATVWAISAGGITLFRQVQLAEEWQSEQTTGFLAGQLRRTMLSLAQEGLAPDDAQILVTGEFDGPLGKLAAGLAERLGVPVQPVQPQAIVLPAAVESERSELMPLLGLAQQAIQNERPPLDFLHPRKPPAPQSNRRKMVLAGTAACLTALLVGWQGHATLNGPLTAAAEVEDKLVEVNRELEPLQLEERDAARIRDWLAASPNVLSELADLSKDWRPQPFDSAEFSLADDAVLKRVDINNRRVVLNGSVTSSAAVQPLENRLRDDGHRVRREQSDPASDGGQYPWEVQIIVDVVDGQPTEPQP